MTRSSSPVLALVEDLFFQAKIEATAAAGGVPIACVRTTDELTARLDRAAGAAGEPAPRTTIFVDLNHRAADPEAVIRALKARRPEPVVIAFGSHQDREGLKAARAAGADQVLARSTFTERLPDLLRGAAGERGASG
ncbi:MAG: hypothetical protein ABR559_03860 [Gemmatimonadota bacterium]